MFLVFFMVLLMTVFGNALIIVTIKGDVRLHTPMYFFLVNLSFLEICYISITIPNILSSLAMQTAMISYAGCMSQVYFFTLCATVECVLLAAMAFDRYVAICQPLHYRIIITGRACLCLVSCAWVCAVLSSSINTFLTLRLLYCGANGVSGLYCEIQPLIRLSCIDTWLNDLCDTLAAAVFGVGCVVFIIISYIFILMAIVKIPHQSRRGKAFSTCASHVTVVILYYGTLIFMYLLPREGSSPQLNMVTSMIYSMGTPLLNPIIYSLRNEQVKCALQKTFTWNSS
ncbi:hypothetical protein GDO86_014708 [Hymenochirus boettgeri]|uniref:Olfactory receptor n=1 Tax=Hymenochirus boettgeri TaxID=247094 RepID=A0A8T2JVB5_9PIPI|nr:hypothetical protein GDO86_014708 [Hymenochirus boettgeri]